MRKSLWFILAVLVAALAAPNARADSTYSAVFTCNSPCTSMPTSTDVTFFTSGGTATFSITWDSYTFAGASLNTVNLPADPYTWAVIVQPLFGCSECLLFQIFDPLNGGGGGGIISPSPIPSEGVIDTGTLSFTPVVATPEPSSVALVLAGIGLVFVMRKRLV